MEFKITGIVRDERGNGVSNLKVRAYDKDLFYDDLLSTAVTAEDGSFEMTYSEKDFKELFENKPEVYLMVFSAEGKLLSRTEVVKWGEGKEKRIEVRVSNVGSVEPPSRSLIAFTRSSPFEFDGNTGDNIPKAVAIIARDIVSGKPASFERVRFRVLSGPLVFAPNQGTSVETTTDAEGRASMDVKFSAQGFSVVVCELVQDPRITAFFRGHSDGVTHRLFIYTEPCVSATSQQIKALISAVDRNGRPVLGANLAFEGHLHSEALAGTVREVGEGVYEGILSTFMAGCWTIQAEDQLTRIVATACVEMQPGPVKDLKFMGTLDPRAALPYGEVVLRACLEDGFGNLCDPSGLQAKAGSGSLGTRVLYGNEARFPLKFAGYGSVEMKFGDERSGLEKAVAVKFASAWLSSAGVIWSGRRFKTEVYWLPDPQRLVTQATIELRFDPALASYVSFKGAPESPVFTEGARVEGGLVSIYLQSEVPVVPQEYPDGVYIGEITWDCLGDGETCFNLVAIMSPPTDPWDYCPRQKNEERNKKCICVRVIHKPGDNAGAGNAKDKGYEAAKQVESVISSTENVESCCPVISVEVDYHEMTAAEWNTLNTDIGGDGAVTGIPDVQKLEASTIGKKAGCINLYMLPFNAGGTLKGLTAIGRPLASLDPSVVGVRPNVGAHEIGHALGLRHDSAGNDPDNLMVNPEPPIHGDELTKDQCKTIWQNIDRYACP